MGSGEREKGGMLDGEREATLAEGERDRERMKKSKTVCTSGCVFVNVHAQGVQRSRVIKRPQKTAMRKREGAIRERKEWALNY